MLPPHLMSMLVTTATVLGFVVMFAWALMIVYGIFSIIGQFRFNRMLRRESRRRARTYSQNQRKREIPDAGRRHDTTAIPEVTHIRSRERHHRELA